RRGAGELGGGRHQVHPHPLRLPGWHPAVLAGGGTPRTGAGGAHPEGAGAGHGRRPPPDRGSQPERLTNSVWWSTILVVAYTQKSPGPFPSVRSHPDDRLVELDGPRGAEEPGIAVVEDPAVGGGKPVAPG